VKVVQATDFGSPYPGSYFPMLRASLLAARERGWSPLAVLPERARQREWTSWLEDEDLELAFAPELSRRRLGGWLEQLLPDDGEPRVVHTHFTRFDLAAAALARRRRDVAVIWSIHTVLSQHPLIRLRNRLKLGLLSAPVKRILCVAPHLVDAVIARGAPPQKVQLFPNGLDTDVFPLLTHGERSAARAALGLPAGATVLMHFGRAWHLKGGDLFLEAAHRLRENGHSDLLAVSVRAPDEAREQAKRMGMADAFVTLEATTHVEWLYGAADLFVASSRGEGAPFAVLEALSSGVPVVASEIPGHEFPFGPLPNLAHAPLDGTALAEAARELLDRDRQAVARDAELTRDGVEAVSSLERWTERLMDLYEELALKPAEGGPEAPLPPVSARSPAPRG
jgi:glycosyltransferase involved in cell wall biosynthesis